MDANRLRSGEFARLCGTTKETLRHYNRIGLLSPAEVDPNGYQFYSAVQLIDFQLIQALRRAGSGLGRIRDCLAPDERAELQPVLRQCLDNLESQKREIALEQRILRDTLTRLELAQENQTSRFTVEESPAEYFVQTAITLPDGAHGLEGPDGDLSLASADLLRTVGDHLAYCAKRGYGTEFQSTTRIGRAAFLSGDYLSDLWICTRVDQSAKDQHRHVKPAGTYLKMVRQVELAQVAEEQHPIALLFDSYTELARFAAKHGHQITGDAYETELSIYTGGLTGSLFSEIAAQITPAE
ncbi:MAG: MerR family transcriptional regulator [Bifidobacteriaceae bacterium]|jgi:DNA-binding transcriptional MerR regulator|nr:MerR family transcriptional regulator [Bifidobacteriaceae bacterium]